MSLKKERIIHIFLYTKDAHFGYIEKLKLL